MGNGSSKAPLAQDNDDKSIAVSSTEDLQLTVLPETNGSQVPNLDLPNVDEKRPTLSSDEPASSAGLLAKAEQKDVLRGTPNRELRYWVAQGDEEKVKEAHKAGADVNAPDLGEIAEKLAEEAEARKKTGKPPSPPPEPAHGSLLATVAEKITGDYPLHLAASAGHVGIIRTLFYFGAKMENRNRIGSTALHRAVSQGHEAAVLELINLGANVHAVNTIGNTPLHVAVMCGHLHLIKLLLQHGAAEDLRKQNKVFMTPFEYTLLNSPERQLLIDIDPTLKELVEATDDEFMKDYEEEKED